MTTRPQPEGAVFGSRLRELREQRGETQQSLADATGFPRPYISNMESGLKVPSLTTLIRLAAALDCNVIDLVDVFTGRDLRKFLPKRK